MSYIKNKIIYEDATGEQQTKHVYTENGEDDGREKELEIDPDGDVIVRTTFEDDGQEYTYPTLYIPRHRIVAITSTYKDP